MSFCYCYLDRPEISVSPNKVYISTLPAQVKFNCTVNSYPESNILWLHKNLNLQSKYQTNDNNKKLRQTHNNNSTRNKTNTKSNRRKPKNNNQYHPNSIDETFNYNLNTLKMKYSVYFNILNETFKQSSILIDVDDENDFGVYECFANNSIGSKTIKFFIYGGNNSSFFLSRFPKILINFFNFV